MADVPASTPALVWGNTRPFDLAVASYKPLHTAIVDALRGRNHPADHYDIFRPPGMRLECPTLNPLPYMGSP